MAAVNIIGVRMANKTQLEAVEKANRNQLEVVDRTNSNQLEIAREANKTQLETNQKAIEAQLKGVRLTNDNTIKAMELSHEKTLKSIQVENALKEELSRKEEQRKNDDEIMTSARVLAVDINIRLNELEDAQRAIEDILQNNSSMIVTLGAGQYISRTYNIRNIDTDFYMKRIAYLPDDCADFVARFYRMMQIVKESYSLSDNPKRDWEDISYFYEALGKENNVKDSEVVRLAWENYNLISFVKLSDMSMSSASTIELGYGALGRLLRILKQDRFAKESDNRAQMMSKKVQELARRHKSYQEKYRNVSRNMESLWSGVEEKYFAPPGQKTEKVTPTK